MQSVVEACPVPRNGVYSAPAAKLAAGAQKAPGLVLQELRAMAAGSLIGFELSREEGPAYEVSCNRLGVPFRSVCTIDLPTQSVPHG